MKWRWVGAIFWLGLAGLWVHIHREYPTYWILTVGLCVAILRAFLELINLAVKLYGAELKELTERNYWHED